MSAALIRRLTAAADVALAEHRIMTTDGYALVPDLLAAELVAGGGEVPRTWQIRRADGRTVYVFRAPAAEVVAP